MAGRRTFIIAADRNEPDLRVAHLYEQVEPYSLIPMCEHGWNRSDGHGFSILRGNGSRRGVCRTCVRRREADLPAVSEPKGHKTKWI